MVAGAEPVRELEGEPRHPLERVPGMRRPPGVPLRGEVRLESHATRDVAAPVVPVRPVARHRPGGSVVRDAVHERFELGRVVPRPPGRANPQRGARRRPGEDMELREVPPCVGIVVRPPRAGAEEDEARGVHRQDLLDGPEGTRGLREQVLQGARDPVAPVVLLQRVEVRDMGKPEGWLEESQEADGPPEAQVEVRADEEAQNKLAPWNPWATLASLPVVDRGGLYEILQEEAGEADLVALPAVVLRPVPTVDTPAYMARALRHWGIPSQARVEGLTVERMGLGLNGYPRFELSAVIADGEFVCTPLVAAKSALEKFDDELLEFGLEYFNAEFDAFMRSTRSLAGHSLLDAAKLILKYTPVVDLGEMIFRQLREPGQAPVRPELPSAQPGLPGFIPSYLP